MNTYTTIFFDYGMYQSHKHKLHNLIVLHNVVLDEQKIQNNVPYQEIVDIYKLFKTENRILNDENLRGRNGATGLWRNETSTLKIIAFDIKEVNESPPVLLVHKGEENSFYITLVKMCINLGCEIGKLEEDENGIREIFKRKLSLSVIEKIRNVEESKEIIKELFDVKIEELQKLGYRFSDSFIKQWESCINTYGYYSINNLNKEIGERNKQENEGDT